MQIAEEQLKRQQQILKELGFYNGPVDGLWGPDSIKAMKKFEQDTSFLPGVPNNGMPFRDHPPYPAGIVRTANGLLHHPVLDKPVEKPVESEKPQQTDKHQQPSGKKN